MPAFMPGEMRGFMNPAELPIANHPSPATMGLRYAIVFLTKYVQYASQFQPSNFSFFQNLDVSFLEKPVASTKIMARTPVPTELMNP
jgi:hypothetical protein